MERTRSLPSLDAADHSGKESAAVGRVALRRKERSESPAKMLMPLLFQDQDEVSRLLPWLLVSLPLENNLISVFHACEEGQWVSGTLGQSPTPPPRPSCVLTAPLPMWTCWIFFFLRTRRPAQALQRSFRLTFLPLPLQLWHLVDICCMGDCTPEP